MSATTAVTSPTAEEEAFLERDRDLHARVLRDMIEREDAYDDMPTDAVLMIVPDDDPAHAEWVIARGAKAVRRGSNVYFRQVRVAELPEPYQTSKKSMVGVRRTEFNWDGSIHSVAVMGDDLEWHEVEPLPEDATELPPSN